jgi:hypothetical protein
VRGQLLRAVELALTGDWQGAHRTVQLHEDDPRSAWIHAILHRQEGDQANAAWWYRRADRSPGNGPIDEELRAAAQMLAC